MSRYTPGSDPEKAGDEINISGKSGRQNVEIEEAEQRRIAEMPEWLLAREVNPHGDSREQLEALGFEVVAEQGLFYKVRPPQGWTKRTQGYWTTVYDPTGVERASQFYKGAWYDTRAFIGFTNSKE